MKTREQIYGFEATAILRDITTYRYIYHKQLLKLYPGKEEKIENLLSYFARQGRIFLDQDTGLYHEFTDLPPDYEMLAALWVLADFSDRTEYHSAVDFPAKLIFIADGELYEVIYIAPDKEALIEHAVLSKGTDAEKRIIIVESTEQISKLSLPDITAYCIVDKNTGSVQYYKQKQEEAFG